MFRLSVRMWAACILCFSSLAAGPAVFAQTLDRVILHGPVDAVDLVQLKVTIAGQAVPVTREVAGALARGNLAAMVLSQGATQPHLLKITQVYVPGTTRVLVTGVASDHLASLARIKIGAVWIDCTKTLALYPSVVLAKGDIFAVIGTQHTSGGTLYALSIAKLGTSTSTPVLTPISVIKLSSGLTTSISGVPYPTAFLDLWYGNSSNGGGIIGGGIVGGRIGGPVRTP